MKKVEGFMIKYHINKPLHSSPLSAQIHKVPLFPKNFKYSSSETIPLFFPTLCLFYQDRISLG
jgi:hypothetical protein